MRYPLIGSLRTVDRKTFTYLIWDPRWTTNIKEYYLVLQMFLNLWYGRKRNVTTRITITMSNILGRCSYTPSISLMGWSYKTMREDVEEYFPPDSEIQRGHNFTSTTLQFMCHEIAKELSTWIVRIVHTFLILVFVIKHCWRRLLSIFFELQSTIIMFA